MARILKRSFGTIPFTANTTVSIDLPRNHVFKSVYLRLTGSLTKTGGSTDGTFNSEMPMSLLRSVAIVRNGSDVLQRADGGTLFALAKINSDGDPQRVGIASGTATAGQVVPFSCDIPIDFASWRMQNPGMTLLRAVGTSSLRLDITWGTTTDLLAGSTGTLSFDVTPSIEVFTEEIMDITGDFGDKLIVVTSRAISVSSTQFTIDLATGPFYRRLVLKTTSNAGNVLSDAVINRVRVISDGSFFHTDRMTWVALQAMNKRNYSLNSALVASPALGGNTNLPGYAIIDFAEDGNPAGLIDTRGASSFQVELDVTSGTTTAVQVIQEQFVPARVATAA